MQVKHLFIHGFYPVFFTDDKRKSENRSMNQFLLHKKYGSTFIFNQQMTNGFFIPLFWWRSTQTMQLIKFIELKGISVTKY